ncbi:ubiquinone/menaquinone biosynthesis methyltransferase protein [Rhizobium leguminosarum bv. trifolii WSM1325]|uniref:Ubiquinone/menaquinone biosynthesis methyltransferase protein n=1 Tax=Rhizobium leguminosarum bv. trifolii (strain WSM1325) TaxID=395491 RepID=C6AVH8_RHILS|nr:ubiquinone/menaquinone biosynthesis methyltransferase protein [Rhizobium leguminosarum bv. trifolii WSM1325]
MISMDFEGSDDRAASVASLQPFEEGVAEFYDSYLVPILFEPYASEMAIVAER